MKINKLNYFLCILGCGISLAGAGNPNDCFKVTISGAPSLEQELIMWRLSCKNGSSLRHDWEPINVNQPIPLEAISSFKIANKKTGKVLFEVDPVEGDIHLECVAAKCKPAS